MSIENKSMIGGGRLVQVELLRAFAVTSLVIWHIFYCPLLCWQISDFDELNPIVVRLLSLSSAFLIPQFNMPLFTFISGVVFIHLRHLNRYSSFNVFLNKKISRLLIPFFALGTVICFTSFEADFASIGFKYMLYGSGSHLWFLTMLFWAFMVGWYCSTNHLLNYLCIAFSFFSPLIFPNFENNILLPWGIHKAVVYYCYFGIGMEFYRLRGKGSNLVLKISIFAMLYFTLFVLISLVKNIDMFPVLCIQSRNVMYILLFYFISEWLINRDYISLNRVRLISKYSFGIYVFHHWIGWNLCHLEFMIKLLESNYILFALTNTLWIFVLSMLITHFCLKTKIGKFLLS